MSGEVAYRYDVSGAAALKPRRLKYSKKSVAVSYAGCTATGKSSARCRLFLRRYVGARNQSRMVGAPSWSKLDQRSPVIVITAFGWLVV